MSYTSTILGDNPLAYYRLDETSGLIAFDSTLHANNGTITNTGVTLGVPGLLIVDTDTAMSFDGATGRITLPTTFLPSGNAPWSIECWAKLPSLPGVSASPLFFGNYSNNVGTFQYLPGDGKWHLFYSSSLSLTGSAASANAIYHLVGTFDGTTLTFYINGGSVATLGSLSLNVVTTYAQIGDDSPAGGDWFPGTIDEVAFYNYALSAIQISNHYTAGTTAYKPVYAYGAQTLHDNVHYTLLSRNYNVPPVKTALYKVARRVGVKTSGAIQDERVIQAVVRIVSSKSFADLEFWKDSLQGGLFQQKQQQLTLSAQDGRYWTADCIGFDADHTPMKGGGFPGSGVLWTDATISFLASYPYAVSPTQYSYDTGSTTLTLQSGTTYAFPTFALSSLAGNIYTEPTIRIYNKTAYPASNNTTLSSQLLINHAYTNLSVAALPQAASSGDVFVIGWGSATQQSVTLSANAAQNATTLSVNNFTANATYPTSTPVDKDFSWTNVTVTNLTDANSLSISTYPSSTISNANGDFIDIFCDPTLPLGYSIVKNSNPSTLLAFNGLFPVVEPISSNWLITITANNLAPTAEAVFTWNPKFLT